MKATLRRITVDNVRYLWRLHKHNGDGDGGIGLRVWRGKTKVVDEWLTGPDKLEAITPAFVVARIRTVVTQEMVRGFIKRHDGLFRRLA